MSNLAFNELEILYDELATAIDTAGPEQEIVFLAKLVLRMAQDLGNAPRISTLIQECLHEPAAPAPAMAGQRLI